MKISEQRWGDLRCRIAFTDADSRPPIDSSLASPGDAARSASPDSSVDRAVILLHGFGASGTDLVGIAHFWQQYWSEEQAARTVCVFPAAPIELRDFGGDARAWWPINFEKLQQMVARNDLSDLEQFEPAELKTRRAQISEVIAQVQAAYGLTSQQIVLGGFSQGAMLAIDAALNFPEVLAGLLIWSGTVIHRQNWEQQAPGKRNLRVLQSHGIYDPILPYSGAQRVCELLQQAGLTIDFCPFPGQHSIDEEILQRSGQWVIE